MQRATAMVLLRPLVTSELMTYRQRDGETLQTVITDDKTAQRLLVEIMTKVMYQMLQSSLANRAGGTAQNHHGQKYH